MLHLFGYMPTRQNLSMSCFILLIDLSIHLSAQQVRPAVKDVLGIQGSFRDGPWSYRICSIVIMSPIYAVLLVGVGTVFGRHFYFRRFSIKIISRFGIPPESLDKNWYKHEKHFRKW